MAIESHKELTIWKKSMDLTRIIYTVTAQLPSTENFGLISQMRRCAVSIPSNIAEGYHRKNRKEYLQF
jgi:four helix bundle protein